MTPAYPVPLGFTAALWGWQDTAGGQTEREEAADQRAQCISGARKHVELEYFHILLCALRTYFQKTRGYCGKTK